MSVAYTGNNSRTERPRKNKIGTEVAHVTRDSETTFKVKRSMVKVASRGVRRLQRGGRENVLAVAVCSAAQGASAPTEEEGRGHTVAAVRLQLVSSAVRVVQRSCKLHATSQRGLCWWLNAKDRDLRS